MADAIGMFLGMFYREAASSARSDPMDELLQVVDRAETAGVELEIVDTIRAKIVEFEQEAQKDLKVEMRYSCSGELITVLKVSLCDTAAMLCAQVHRELGDAGVALRLIFEASVMENHTRLSDVGVSDGDSLFVVQTPLRCLTAALDGTARIHCLGRSPDQEVSVASHDGRILSAAVSPDTLQLLTVSAEGRAVLWCPQTGDLRCELDGEVLSCSFSSDGRRIVGHTEDGLARIWCSQTGKCKRVLCNRSASAGDAADAEENEEVRFTAFSPNGDMIVTCQGKIATLWDAETGQCTKVLSGHKDAVRFADFSPDGLSVATASGDATACVWDVDTGECLRVLAGHSKDVLKATWSPDQRQIMTFSFDGTVRLWDSATGESTMTLPTDNNVVNSAVFSPDGSGVLLASGSEIIRVFSSSSGECILSLSGHDDWVRSAAFSPDGTLVSTASYDGTARIWSTVSGECLKMLKGHSAALLLAEIITG